jgi:hypothetical protein
MRSDEIRMNKYDYYIIAIVVICVLLFMFYIFSKPSVGEVNDNYYHMGYVDCERNYNFTSDEMMLLNTYRIYKIENKTIEVVVK